MKNALTGFLLSSLFLAGSAAHAATQLSTSGFDLELTESVDSSSFGMNVVSDENGTIKIAMRGAGAPDIALQADYSWRSDGDQGWTQLSGSVRQGYQITSLTLSGTLTGLLEVDTSGVGYSYWNEGKATNSAKVRWSIWQPDLAPLAADWKTENLNGVTNFSMSLALHNTGTFVSNILSLEDVFALCASVTYPYGEIPILYRGPSRSEIRFGDMMLTAQVSAVPEPETYVMLLAGLGLMALGRRVPGRARGD